MNYIKLINNFWQVKRDREDFDSYVISLYFALLDIANRREWKPFSVYRDDILVLTNMSFKPYYKAREILRDSGLISCEEGANGRKKCSFTILPPSPTVTVQTTVQATVGDTVPTTVEDTILNKHINLKTNKPLNTTEQQQNSGEKVSEYLNNALKPFTPPPGYEQKKASHTGGAALTDSVAHPFRESPLFDKEKFRLAMEREGFETLDPDYYHGILRNWSELGTKLRPGEQLSHNWLRELRNFIQRDKSENKLRLKKEKPAKALRITSTDTNINYDELSKQYGYTG
ncbi:hypothetical protein [Adhaeribacter aquaticus]|uniref:hypothetical protein n=1 Tax=Adhaeribacter aquaticus TaxID=299567 RepID=UPI000423271D|nr:hypothetical protein [Adhaeribacter aquaticus]